MIGTKLAHYEITSHLGSGGMGEVYQATDAKLGRSVAIKLLPEAFSHDNERVARFEREARVLASLNHPNIAAIHGLEESAGRKFLVMELVSGETLAERIKRSRIPIDESLGIAQQIAEALEAAHEKGIIHRDLKPANVKITPDGKVKVLDFGLAKAFAAEGPNAHLSNSPTVSMAATNAGIILGTAAYMSPEQARGKPVDKRTDIWGFGCVLYELLTGKQAFRGEDVTEILASIVKSEPDWMALPGDTPPAVGALLRRCLRKDAQQRPKDAGDISIEIVDARAAASSVTQTAVVQVAASAPPRWRWALVAGVAGALLAGFAVWNFRPTTVTAPKPIERLTIALGRDSELDNNAFAVLALSPDGGHLAYVASENSSTSMLHLRSMDALEARPIPGTEGAQSPFFSPDGQWIGFFSGNSLKKVSITGGAVLTLYQGPLNPRGGAWSPDDTIVFSPLPNETLWRISAAGGQPERFTAQQSPGSHRWPQFLPDGKTVLFTAEGTFSGPDDANIAIQRLDSSESKVLIRGGTYARYVPTGASAGLKTGHLVYYHAGTIMAVSFDPYRLELRGAPAPIQQGVMSSVGNIGAAQFSFSDRGTLVYVPGGPQLGHFTMVWVDRNGREESLPALSRVDSNVRLSPDGRRAALTLENDIWIYDLSRGTESRLTFEDINTGPQWTPDGKRIAFRRGRGSSESNIYWKLADGTGPEERLTTSQNPQLAASFTPDGKTLMYSEIDPKTKYDLWVLPLEGQRKPQVYLQTPFNEGTGRISPDGRWVAYLSDESGRYEIYVRPFPNANGGKWQISTDGGQEISWAPNGKELFYRTGSRRQRMMVVDVQTQPSFVASTPRLLFEAPYYSRGTTGADYWVSPDGKRFLMIKTPEQKETSTQINVVLNWFEELKQKAPVK